MAGIPANNGFDVRWPALIDRRSGPYNSVEQALDPLQGGVMLTRRAEGLVLFVRNAPVLEWWQFVGGRQDEHLTKIEFGGDGGGGGLFGFQDNEAGENRFFALGAHTFKIEQEKTVDVFGSPTEIINALSFEDNLDGLPIVSLKSKSGSQECAVLSDIINGGASLSAVDYSNSQYSGITAGAGVAGITATDTIIINSDSIYVNAQNGVTIVGETYYSLISKANVDIVANSTRGHVGHNIDFRIQALKTPGETDPTITVHSEGRLILQADSTMDLIAESFLSLNADISVLLQSGGIRLQGNVDGVYIDAYEFGGKVVISEMPEYPDNAAAAAAFLPAGSLYRTGDLLKIVH